MVFAYRLGSIISEVFYNLMHSVILRGAAVRPLPSGGSAVPVALAAQCRRCSRSGPHDRGRHCLGRNNGATPGQWSCPRPERRARRPLLPAEPPRRAGRVVPLLCACPAPPRPRPGTAPAPAQPPPRHSPRHRPGPAASRARLRRDGLSWPRGCFAEGSPCLGPHRDSIGAASARDSARRQPWTGTGWR